MQRPQTNCFPVYYIPVFIPVLYPCTVLHIMSPDPVDKKLYDAVKRAADGIFFAKTSAYKSGWIVRKYKEQGGTYSAAGPNTSGLKRWFSEKWVDTQRPIKKNGDCRRTFQEETRESQSIKK